MTAEQLLTRLADAKRSGNGWIARCPVHDDDKPSLSIAQADGRILLKCFAGCRTADIVRALNLTMADLFVSNDGHGQRAGSSSDPLHWLASYCQVPKAFLEKLPLSADNGRVVFKFDGTDVVKLRLAGAKDFRWQPVGAPTPPLWPLPGAELPEQIWLCEGESDTIVARYLGLEAFAVTKGAGTSLKPHEAEALAQRGAKAIVIAFDADGDGRAGARKLADVLAGAGLAVRIVDLAEAGLVDPLLASKDLRDAWRASQDREALRQQLVAAADCAEILSAALTVDIPAERILPFRTARELAQETPPEVDWLARPWVATGAITEVDGMVKLAGKTTWVMHLVRAVLDGKPFLAEPTRKTAVVYLSEQTGPSLRQALARAGLLDRDDLVLLRWHDTIAVPWPEVVSAAVAEASRRGAALLVVDVLSQFAGLSGDAENNAGAAQEALAPLQQAAGRGLAVVIVRHERKGGGEVGEAARGSSAFGGGVDIIISIRRHQGETRPAIRVLHTLSRFDETPNELVIELTPAGYVVVGSEAAFAVAEAKEAILDVIPASEMAAVTLDELADKTAVKRTSLQQAVHEMLRAGELKRLGQGKRGDPYRFYRAISFAAASVREQEFLSAGIPTI